VPHSLFKTWAEIDLDALRDNLQAVRSLCGPGVGIVAGVKADAYGHGVFPVSRVLAEEEVEFLGVSHVKEALELRGYFPRARILILSSGMAGHTEPIVRNGLTPVVCSLEIARELAQEAIHQSRPVSIHVMVDTGMGRIGVWHETAAEFVVRLARIKGIRLEGICSHFATADEEAPDFMLEQHRRFAAVLSAVAAAGVNLPLIHIANSGAIITLPEARHNLVRPGLMLYGIHPAEHLRGRVSLRPVLSLKTQVAFLKSVKAGRTISYGRSFVAASDTRIATLPIGYADGFSRAHSGRGQVLIRARRAPIVGNVTMDQLMVDVGHIPDVSVGDEAVLIGRQGAEEITAVEAAERIGTISYEVLSQLGKRVSRVYLQDPAYQPS